MTWPLVTLSKICVILSQLNSFHMQDEPHHQKNRLIFSDSIVFHFVITRQRTEQSHAMSIPSHSGPNGAERLLFCWILSWSPKGESLPYWLWLQSSVWGFNSAVLWSGCFEWLQQDSVRSKWFLCCPRMTVVPLCCTVCIWNPGWGWSYFD